jgi:rhodanese-related sulfurtransferase
MSSAPLNRRLGALAIALGAVAVFAQPQRGPFVKLDTQQLAMIVEQEVDHVTPAELAAWIVEGRSDYRLLDLRGPAEYAEYHIPTAENVTLPALEDYPLLPSEKIVIYSQGGIHAAQAWLLMQARGFRGSYTLLGGLDGWIDEVLYPALPAEAGREELARFEQAAALAKFFGGQPRSATDAPAAGPAELPKLAAPVASGPVLPAAPRGKKKEGC